jgi:hypothetical protein
MIIGLSGYAQSGKDTCADYISSEYGFVKVAFGGVLREALWALNPWVGVAIRYQDAVHAYGYNEAKEIFPEIRRLLQYMGTDVGREILGPDVWVNALMSHLTPGYDYVISDVRFPNEYDAIKKNGGVIFRINREDTAPINEHSSEIALDEHEFDGYLHNVADKNELYDQIKLHMVAYSYPPIKLGESND